MPSGDTILIFWTVLALVSLIGIALWRRGRK